MARYEVERTIRTVVTVSESTEGTARSSAQRKLRERLDEAKPESGSFTVERAAVYEQPAAPFEPYRIAVTATLGVALSGDDTSSARTAGADRIDSWLAASGLDGYAYESDPAVTNA